MLVLTRRVGQSVMVAHACPRAALAGVRTDMTLGQAQALLSAHFPPPDDAPAAEAEPVMATCEPLSSSLPTAREATDAPRAPQVAHGKLESRCGACGPGHTARGGLPALRALGRAAAAPAGLTPPPEGRGGLLIAEHDAPADAAFLAEIADWAIRFSPLVQTLAPPLGPGLLLDISGCQRLFGGESNIARQVLGGVLQRGLEGRLAVADTIGAAYALAWAATEAVTLAPPGQALPLLAKLPPAALRLDHTTRDRLEMLGVRSIADLLSLPRAALPGRFGPDLPRRIQQALGEAHELVIPAPERLVFAVRRELEHPLRSRSAVQQVVADMLPDLFAQVSEAQCAIRRLDCVLYCEAPPEEAAVSGGASAARRDRGTTPASPGSASRESAPGPARMLAPPPFAESPAPAAPPSRLQRRRPPPLVVELDLTRPARDVERVCPLLAQQLEQAPPCGDVIGLMLVAREAPRWKPVQSELFAAGTPPLDESLAHLADQLAARLGHAALLRPLLLDDYQPEKAFRYVTAENAGLAPAALRQFAPPPAASPRPARAADHGLAGLTEAERNQHLDKAWKDGLAAQCSIAAVPLLDATTPPAGGPAPANPLSPGRASDVAAPRASGPSFHAESAGGQRTGPSVDRAAEEATSNPKRSAPQSDPGSALLPAARPLRLLPAPLPLAVVALLPDGPPARVTYQGAQHDVAYAWGPERIETAWWRGPDVQRDYFRVTLAGGEQLWLFRDRAAGGWFLHGLFV